MRILKCSPECSRCPAGPGGRRGHAGQSQPSPRCPAPLPQPQHQYREGNELIAIQQVPAGDSPGGQGRAGPLLLEQPEPGVERGGLSEGVLLFHGQRSTSPDPPSPQDSELPSGRFSSPQAKREGQLSSCEGMKCLGHRTWHLVFTESAGGPQSSCGSWCPHAHGPHHPQPGISRPDPCPGLAHPLLQSSKRPLSWIVCSCISESPLREGEDPEDEDSAPGKQRPQRAWEGSPEEAASGGWRRPECETKGSCGRGAGDAGLGAGGASSSSCEAK